MLFWRPARAEPLETSRVGQHDILHYRSSGHGRRITHVEQHLPSESGLRGRVGGGRGGYCAADNHLLAIPHSQPTPAVAGAETCWTSMVPRPRMATLASPKLPRPASSLPCCANGTWSAPDGITLRCDAAPRMAVMPQQLPAVKASAPAVVSVYTQTTATGISESGDPTMD